MDIEIVQQKEIKAVPKLRFNEFEGKWSSFKLIEGINLVSGQHLSPEEYQNSSILGFPYFTGPSDFTDCLQNVKKWTSASNHFASRDDILITVKGNGVGTMMLLKLEKVAMGRQLMAIKSCKFNSEFVYHYLLTKLNLFVALASGNLIPGLSRQDILTLKISVPFSSEQQKIASFLSAVDKKNQQLTRKKELLETYKKGVMQQLFSQEIRFMRRDGNDYPEWKNYKLKERVSLIKDGTHGTHKDVINSGYFLLSAKNIHDGKIHIDSNDRQISENEYNNILKNYHFQEGDIFLSIVGTIGRSCVYKGEQNIVFQRSVAFFRFSNDNSEFIYHYFNSSAFQKELKKRQVVSAQPGIYLGDLSKINLCLPNIIEQQKIAELLSAIDRKIEAVQQQIEKTQRFKKGLLQQMFV